MSHPPDISAPADQEALLEAIRALLFPLAQLAVNKGLHYAAVEEALRAAFVQEARAAAMRARPDALPHRLVSKIATTTGLNRREVTRLMSPGAGPAVQRRSPALEAFFRWVSQVDAQAGGARRPRQGSAGSFEALAQSVTKDVHPRSILDDLLRLGLVRCHEADDSVELLRCDFVPDDDEQKMLGYLGYNVGDHLQAAVDNVSGQRPKHLEQSLHATGVPAAALPELQNLARAMWRQVSREWIPLLQGKIDASDDAEPTRRVRLGIYLYDGPNPSGSDQKTQESQ
ncbi:MAG: hypothetical protein C4K60_09415 [Ideonella sp. MAG2]|nr:MAG: hypothetical protein C4K60_09415 [Ideonella sp. MAG2]